MLHVLTPEPSQSYWLTEFQKFDDSPRVPVGYRMDLLKSPKNCARRGVQRLCPDYESQNPRDPVQIDVPGPGQIRFRIGHISLIIVWPLSESGGRVGIHLKARSNDFYAVSNILHCHKNIQILTVNPAAAVADNIVGSQVTRPQLDQVIEVRAIVPCHQ